MIEICGYICLAVIPYLIVILLYSVWKDIVEWKGERRMRKSDCQAVLMEDVTGEIGRWLDCDLSDIPTEAIKHLEIAYTICAKTLAGVYGDE